MGCRLSASIKNTRNSPQPSQSLSSQPCTTGGGAPCLCQGYWEENISKSQMWLHWWPGNYWYRMAVSINHQITVQPLKVTGRMEQGCTMGQWTAAWKAQVISGTCFQNSRLHCWRGAWEGRLVLKHTVTLVCPVPCSWEKASFDELPSYHFSLQRKGTTDIYKPGKSSRSTGKLPKRGAHSSSWERAV